MKLEQNYIPKVLLLGNGLNNWSEYHSWTSLLKELCVKEEIRHYFDDDVKKCMPMTMQAVLAANDNIREAIRVYNQKHGCTGNTNPFYGKITSVKQADALKKILSAGFDAILTTNYSYELELAACNKDSFTSESQVRKLSESLKEKKEPKYLLSTYNKVIYEGTENKIFHIHGEARKPDSMILGSYYYAGLLERIISEARSRGNQYANNRKKGLEQPVDSWIDLFLLGDVYILGFGFDFSEIDLWWLINRKKREKAAHGTVFYYDLWQEGMNEKNMLLELMGAETRNLGIFLQEGSSEEIRRLNNEKFDRFYPSAISHILQDMKR